MRIVKIGGGVIPHLDAFREYLKGDIYIHGASDYVDEICRRAGVEVKRFRSVSGIEFRYTPREVLEYYVMGVMWANKELVSYLHRIGINAIGISGVDLALIKAKRKRIVKIVDGGKKRVLRDDHSGKIEEIDKGVIKALMEIGVPVIASLALGEEYVPLNVDGDTLASKIAAAFHADELLFLSDSAFLKEGSVVPEIPVEKVEEYIEHSSGGMRRKLKMAEEAIRSGVGRVIIQGLNGRTVIR